MAEDEDADDGDGDPGQPDVPLAQRLLLPPAVPPKLLTKGLVPEQKKPTDSNDWLNRLSISERFMEQSNVLFY